MRFFAAIAIALVSACTTSGSQIPPGPKAWQDGYAQGCNSGFAAAGNPYYRYTKDVVRVQTDQTFAMGWQDGYNACNARYNAINSRY